MRSAATSPMTATGGQKAPAAFLAAARSTATLPPMAESAWASHVVGTCDERRAPEVQRRGGAHEVAGRAAADGDPGVAALGAHARRRPPAVAPRSAAACRARRP